MRLFKKAAVCLLAAAMAVSMLTACGDDGPSNPGNGGNGGNGGSTGGGNTSTSTPAKPDDEDSSTTPEKPETPKEDEKTVPTSWNDSITKEYYISNKITDANIYVYGSVTVHKGNGSGPNYTVKYVAKGSKTFLSLDDGKKATQYYKDTSGEYYENSGTGWTKAVDESVETALNTYQMVYKVPTTANVKNYQGIKSGRFIIEMLTVLRNSSSSTYGYQYNQDNEMKIMTSFVGSNMYTTSVINVTACPNSFAFPNT